MKKFLVGLLASLMLMAPMSAMASQTWVYKDDTNLHADLVLNYYSQSDTYKQFNQDYEENILFTKNFNKKLAVFAEYGIGQLNGNTAYFAPRNYQYQAYNVGLKYKLAKNTELMASWGQVPNNNGIGFGQNETYHQFNIGLTERLF